jgi:hypothetical protein
MTKKFVEVFWTPYFNKNVSQEFESNILFSRPKPLFPMLLDARKGRPYMACPAVAQEAQNDFVVCAPYDLIFSFDVAQGAINIDRFGQKYADSSITLNWDGLPQNIPPLIHTPPRYVMYAFEDVNVEVVDLPIITSTFSKNVKMIRGGFNISKWCRPLEAAFEVVDISKPVVLEAGEPMFLIRLHTPNNVPVKLTRVEMTPDLEERIQACLLVKSKRQGIKLPKLYDLASSYLELFKQRKQKND